MDELDEEEEIEEKEPTFRDAEKKLGNLEDSLIEVFERMDGKKDVEEKVPFSAISEYKLVNNDD